MVIENIQKVLKMSSQSTSKEFYKFKCISLNEIGTSDIDNCNIIYEKSEAKIPSNYFSSYDTKIKSTLPSTFSLPNIVDDSYAIVVLGELNVGKSALCRNFFRSGLEHFISKHSKIQLIVDDLEDDLFDEQTIDFANNHHIFERPIIVNGVGNRVRILDVNTKKQFLESKPEDGFSDLNQYLNIGDGCIVAYTCTDYSTFETAKNILKKIQEIQYFCNRDISVVLVGNKCDLVRKRQVSIEDGMKLAEKFDVKFIETSAILSENIEQLFQGLVHQIRLRETIFDSDCGHCRFLYDERDCFEFSEKQRFVNSNTPLLKSRYKNECEGLAHKCWRKINMKKDKRKKRCLDFNVV